MEDRSGCKLVILHAWKKKYQTVFFDFKAV